MTEDWYVAEIDRIDRAAIDLHDSIDRLVDLAAHARRERLAGVGLVEIVQDVMARDGREVRLRTAAAFAAFEHAMTVYRSAVIRAIVDDEHMTFSEVGRLLGVSRQMIARLYRAAPRSTEQ